MHKRRIGRSPVSHYRYNNYQFAVPGRKSRAALIACNTGANPCVIVGGTSASQRANLSMEGIYLNGPGRTIMDSEGIRFLATADEAMLSDIRIDNFDIGMHFVATGSDLLYGDYCDARINWNSWAPSIHVN
jgi:hypothetical protein